MLQVLLLIGATIFIIIGLPMYMVGCDYKIGGYCNGFDKHTAQVIDNQCHLTSGYISHGNSGSDDVGFNCNVHVQYIKDGKNVTCPVYRSDSDGCSPLVDTWTQVRKCTKLNNKDYPLGKIFNIYVNRVDKRCETHHYVQMYAIVGFVFLVLGGLFFSCALVIYIKNVITPSIIKYQVAKNVEVADLTLNVNINKNIETV
jgi:hypothetical protein